MKPLIMVGTLLLLGVGCDSAQPTDSERYLQDENRIPWWTIVTFRNGTAELTAQFQLTPEERTLQKKGLLHANTVGTESYPCGSPFFEVSDGSSIDYGDHLCLVDKGTNSSFPATPPLSNFCLVPSNCSLGTWNAHIRSFRSGYMSGGSGAHIYYNGTDCSAAIYGTNGITNGVGDVDAAHTTSCEQNGDHFSFIDFIP
jgi:hypothetical protein